MVKRSAIVDSFSEEDASEKVHARLESINVPSSEEVKKIDSEQKIAMPGLSLKEKSLVALTSLVALNKEEKSKIYFMDFLNAGGTLNEVIYLLLHIGKELDKQASSRGLKRFHNDLIEKAKSIAILTDVEAQFAADVQKTALEGSLIDLLRLTLVIVSEDAQRMETTFSIYLKHDIKNIELIRHVLMHLVVSGVFPVRTDGFLVLKKSLIAIGR